MTFNCKMCDYSTDTKHYFVTHLKSKNHIKKCEKDLKCSFCLKIFTTKYNLRNHIKNICNTTKIIEEYIINDLNTKIETEIDTKKETVSLEEYYKLKYKLELEEQKTLMAETLAENYKKIADDNKKIADENSKYFKDLVIRQTTHSENVTKVADNATKVAGTATKVAAKSMSALKFLQQNFTNANTIEQHIPKNQFYPYTIGEFIRHLLRAYEEKDGLTSFIENHILAVYKKEDPSKQVLWNSDMNRRSYITHIKTDNNTTCWKKDPTGEKVHSNVIIPAVQYAAELIESVITPLYKIRVYLDYVDNNYKLTHVDNIVGIPDVMDFSEFNKLPLLKKIETSGKLMLEVDAKIQKIGLAKADLLEKNLKDDVKKRIAPQVYLDVPSMLKNKIEV